MSESVPEVTLGDLRQAVEEQWPARIAEPWDRIGLITGRDSAPIRRVLLAVDAVRATVEEAISTRADLLLTHHPLLLRGAHTIAEDTAKGAMLASLVRAECALLAAHTNADAPAGGVSDVIARRLDLCAVSPVVGRGGDEADQTTGIGRVGELPAPMTLRELATRLADLLPPTVTGVRVAGDPMRPVKHVALCGGAGDSLLEEPLVKAADVYITSDLRHHPAQEAIEQGMVTQGPALIDVSHWASESLWLQSAADQLRERFPSIEIQVSALRTDPWDFAVGATG